MFRGFREPDVLKSGSAPGLCGGRYFFRLSGEKVITGPHVRETGDQFERKSSYLKLGQVQLPQDLSQGPLQYLVQ